MRQLTRLLKESEDNNEAVKHIELTNEHGSLAKSLAADLEHDLEKGDLTMYYQPQYDDKDKCIGAEALLRWKHPVYGYVYPPLIIELAEESNILTQLEYFVFRKVCEDMQLIKQAARESIKISLNVTVSTLLSDGFDEFIRRTVKECKAEPQDMCIEITEQMAFKSGEDTSEIFNKLKAMGFCIAIDDFSMGYTSLKYLQNSRFDMVKLDGSIVREIENNPRNKEIISSIIYLSQSLGFSVLAEFVETETIRDSLKNINCRLYQGYLYSPAINSDDFIDVLKS